MKTQVYKEELLYSVEELQLSEEAYSAIQSTIYHNHAVGFIAGYYDENLTIAYISEFFLHNLGYSYEEFMNRTSGSLKNVVYGKNCAYIENDRFRYISGKGEMQMQENLKLISQGIKLWQLWRLSLRRFPVSLPWKRPFPRKISGAG